MKNKTHLIAKGFWFTTQIILIFIFVQAIAYAVGHFDAETIAMVLLGVSAVLFLAVLYNTIRKDKNQKNGFAV